MTRSRIVYEALGSDAAAKLRGDVHAQGDQRRGKARGPDCLLIGYDKVRQKVTSKSKSKKHGPSQARIKSNPSLCEPVTVHAL
jgi:hypothetical protein